MAGNERVIELYADLHDKIRELSAGTVGSKPVRLSDPDYRDSMFDVLHNVETDIALYKSELRKYDDKDGIVR